MRACNACIRHEVLTTDAVMSYQLTNTSKQDVSTIPEGDVPRYIPRHIDLCFAHWTQMLDWMGLES